MFSQRLDRTKPLWELWLVEGLADGRFALISKTHHSLVDGVSGVDLATALFDLDARRGSPSPAPRPWVAAARALAAPSSRRVAVDRHRARASATLPAKALARRSPTRTRRCAASARR